MEHQSVYQRLITSAAARVGGTDELAQRLGIATTQMNEWLAGRGAPEMPLVMQMMEIVLDG